MTVPQPPQPGNIGPGKTYAALAAGFVMTILAYILSLFHLSPPDGVINAVQGLLTMVLVYVVPHDFGASQ